jgi:hypothetical protein
VRRSSFIFVFVMGFIFVIGWAFSARSASGTLQGLQGPIRVQGGEVIGTPA